MLSEKLIDQFRQWGKDAAQKQEQFVALYGQACIECGGNGWHDADIESFFKTVQKELKPILVGEGILAANVFYAYCHAARLALLFDVPFSFADRCRTAHLPEVVKLVAEDQSADPKPIKFRRALTAVRLRHHKAAPRAGDRCILPVPQADENAEQLQYRFAKMLIEYSEDDKVKPLLDDIMTRQMLRLAEGIVAIYEKGTGKNPVAA